MTSEHSVSKKEPLVHISKRDRISFGKAWGIRIIAVLISLVVCALVIVALTKLNPLEVYRSIADGDRKSTRLNSSHTRPSRMPSSA